MKQKKIKKKTNFFKKIFIKISRNFGYELIDQGNFYLSTQNKNLNENLNIQGSKSIALPLGEIKITRPVKALTVIFRSCTNVNMLTQNKKRLFSKEKSEYTFRSLNSIVTSLNKAKLLFPNISFNFIITDFNSNKNDINQMNKQLSKLNIPNSIISIQISEFIDRIKKTNEKNEKVTKNQISNMTNIYKSLKLAKKNSNDLIYFVEDDYIHKNNTIQEMILTYERISSQLNKELILCPADYPYLYSNINSTNVFLGSSSHWREVDQTLCTFLTSHKIIEKHWNRLISMCEFEHYPFEKPLHEIYKTEICLSPIPSLAIHLTNINSIFGLSPNLDWEKIWKENENY